MTVLLATCPDIMISQTGNRQYKHEPFTKPQPMTDCDVSWYADGQPSTFFLHDIIFVKLKSSSVTNRLNVHRKVNFSHDVKKWNVSQGTLSIQSRTRFTTHRCSNKQSTNEASFTLMYSWCTNISFLFRQDRTKHKQCFIFYIVTSLKGQYIFPVDFVFLLRFMH